MSVIHSVLTKLDARGAQRPAAVSEMPAFAVQPNGPSRRVMVMAGVGVAAIAFVVLADWPSWLRSANAARALPTAAAAANAAPVVEQPPAVVDVIVTPARAPAADTTPAAAVQPVATPAPPPSKATAAAPHRLAVSTVPRERTAAALAAPAVPAAVEKRDVAPAPSQRALTLLRQASESAQAGQPRAALERAREALALDATLGTARLLAAVLEHDTGNSERAAQLLREGLARDPRDTAQALLLARVLVAQGDSAGALTALERHGVQGAEADGLRGGILTQQGDSARALPAYESAARQQPANAMWWLGLGVALDAERQPQRARQAYARALAIGLPRDDLVQYADQRLRAHD